MTETSSFAIDAVNADTLAPVQVRKRVTDLLRAHCVAIVVPESAAGDPMVQAMAVHAVSNVARLFPHIALEVPSTPSQLRLHPGPLDAALRDFVERTDPRVQIDNAEHAFRLTIASQAATRGVTVDANGWLVHASTSGASAPWQGVGARLRHPASAMAAAALGTMAALDAALGPVTPRTICLNLLTYTGDTALNPPLPSPLHLNANFLGTGSIGSAAVHALALHEDVTGDVTLVDPDGFATRNGPRYATFQHAMVGRKKVSVLESTLSQGTRVHVRALPATIQEWGQTLARDEPVALSVISPDTINARREAADLLARDAVVATAEQTTAIVGHCHFARTICPFCLYMPQHAPPNQYQFIAELVGLSEERVKECYVFRAINPAKSRLREADIRLIERKLRMEDGDLTDDWVGKTLAEFVDVFRARLYSTRPYQAGESLVEVRVPTSAVSSFSAAMAIAETIKETVSPLHEAATTYDRVRVDLSQWSVDRDKMNRALNCLCDDLDRQKWFGDIWPEERRHLLARSSRYREAMAAMAR